MSPRPRSALDALRAKHQEMIDLQPDQDRIRLYNELKIAGRRRAIGLLRRLDQTSLDLQTAPARTRSRELASQDRKSRSLTLYAAAAWSAKTVRLFELIEAGGLSPLDLSPKGQRDALLITVVLERDWSWLWPYPGLSPFQDEPEFGPDDDLLG